MRAAGPVSAGQRHSDASPRMHSSAGWQATPLRSLAWPLVPSVLSADISDAGLVALGRAVNSRLGQAQT